MIIFTVTFSLFFIEALLHYNFGSKKAFHIPSSKDCLHIIITVAIFSYANARIIKYLSSNYNTK